MLNKDVWDVIQSASINATKDFLSEYIDQATEHRLAILRDVVEDFPLYKRIVGEPSQYINHVPMNVSTSEEMHKTLAVSMARDERNLKRISKYVIDSEPEVFENDDFYQSIE